MNDLNYRVPCSAKLSTWAFLLEGQNELGAVQADWAIRLLGLERGRGLGGWSGIKISA